jgi:uncharacterized protein (DUF4415 family)
MQEQDSLEYYKNFDTSKVAPIKHPLVKKLQERHAVAQTKVLDADVVTWLNSQDAATKQHINEVIRHFMAVKTA